MPSASQTSQSSFRTDTVVDPVRDADEVIRIWRQHHTGDPSARYRWLFQAPEAEASCLLLRDANGDAIGTTSLVVRRFRRGGDVIVAGHTIDLVVDPRYRSGGPAIQLQRALLALADERRIGLLYGAPVRAAELIQRRVGYRVLGQLHRWRKSLDAAHDLTPRISLQWLCRLIGWLADRMISVYSGEVLLAMRGRWSVSIESHFGDGFDDLWSRVRGRTEIIGERTSAYLRWRFGPGAPRDCRVFCLSDGGGRLAGYIVYSCSEDGADVADLLFADTRSLRALLAHFSRAMRREGMKHITVNTLEPPSVAAALKRAGFFQRPQQANVLVWTSEELARSLPELQQPENWFLTDADRDV